MELSRYQEMSRNVENLRNILLPENFSPTGNYEDTERVCILAVSFRVLSHAEVESYLEDRAMAATDQAWKAWSKYGIATRTALSLIAYSGTEMTPPPETLQARQPSQEKNWNEKIDINSKLKSAITKYNNYIKRKNHGIKEENILAILLPIGIRPEKIDQTLLADLNNFGESRGLAAHSKTERAQQGIDPKSEYDKVLNIIKSLAELDNEIDKLFVKPRAQFLAKQ